MKSGGWPQCCVRCPAVPRRRSLTAALGPRRTCGDEPESLRRRDRGLGGTSKPRPPDHALRSARGNGDVVQRRCRAPRAEPSALRSTAPPTSASPTLGGTEDRQGADERMLHTAAFENGEENQEVSRMPRRSEITTRSASAPARRAREKSDRADRSRRRRQPRTRTARARSRCSRRGSGARPPRSTRSRTPSPRWRSARSVCDLGNSPRFGR